MKKIIEDILIKKRAAIQKPKDSTPTSSSKSIGKFVFFILILALFIILSIKILNIFSGVTVQIEPRKETVNIDAVIKAGKAGVTENADISFETMEITTEKYKTFDVLGFKYTEIKASGQIVVYNNYSKDSQTLVKNTRFETPDGKIFRIDKPVIISGTKIEDGKTVPGSAKAVVYADLPGEDYNVGFSDFTIPGFKGGPRYEKFYARSETPITGGLKGQIPTVSDEELKTIDDALQATIKEELVGKAKIQKLNDFIYYESLAKIEFSEPLTKTTLGIDEDSQKAKIQKTGVLYAPLFSKKELSRVLVQKYLNNPDLNDKVSVLNFEQLNIELVSEDKESEILTFRLTGNVVFVWLLDEEKIKEMLVASSREIETVFKDYPAVSRISVIFEPSWWPFFPEKKSKINIEQII